MDAMRVIAGGLPGRGGGVVETMGSRSMGVEGDLEGSSGAGFKKLAFAKVRSVRCMRQESLFVAYEI